MSGMYPNCFASGNGVYATTDGRGAIVGQINAKFGHNPGVHHALSMFTLQELTVLVKCPDLQREIWKLQTAETDELVKKVEGYGIKVTTRPDRHNPSRLIYHFQICGLHMRLPSWARGKNFSFAWEAHGHFDANRTMRQLLFNRIRINLWLRIVKERTQPVAAARVPNRVLDSEDMVARLEAKRQNEKHPNPREG